MNQGFRFWPCRVRVIRGSRPVRPRQVSFSGATDRPMDFLRTPLRYADERRMPQGVRQRKR